MGMPVDGLHRGVQAELNVVPLIDILLVLLVIFMSASSQQKGLDASLPHQAKPAVTDPVDAVVVQVLSDSQLRVNQQPVKWADLGKRLDEIFRGREHKVAFLRGDAPVEFALIARAIDVMHGSGVTVGLLTPGLEQNR